MTHGGGFWQPGLQHGMPQDVKPFSGQSPFGLGSPVISAAASVSSGGGGGSDKGMSGCASPSATAMAGQV